MQLSRKIPLMDDCISLGKPKKTVQEIRLEYVQLVIHSCVMFVIFLISRPGGENSGFLAGVPLLPYVWSRALIPFPFSFEGLPRRLTSKRQKL